MSDLYSLTNEQIARLKTASFPSVPASLASMIGGFAFVERKGLR